MEQDKSFFASYIDGTAQNPADGNRDVIEVIEAVRAEVPTEYKIVTTLQSSRAFTRRMSRDVLSRLERAGVDDAVKIAERLEGLDTDLNPRVDLTYVASDYEREVFKADNPEKQQESKRLCELARAVAVIATVAAVSAMKGSSEAEPLIPIARDTIDEIFADPSNVARGSLNDLLNEVESMGNIPLVKT